MFSWIVKQSFSLLMGLSLIACEFAGGAATDGVNYGYLPQVSNLPERTMSAWIYVHTAPSTVSYFIMGPMSDAAGAIISVGATGAIEFPRVIQYYQKGVTGAGGWRTPNESVPLNAWTHVLATRDSSNPVNLPIVYINGVAQSLTELASQGGATTDETGANFVVGNAKTIAWDYIRPFDGLIKDARVYNRILTAAEALTLASGGIVTDGLVFQTPCVRVKELTAYTDLTLTAEEKLLDNLYGAVGSPHGSPVTRLGAFFPVFDAATGNAATTDVTISDTHTASGLNRFAKVSLYLSGAVTDLVVTYDGVAMTQIGTKTVPDGGKRVYVFGLVNPPTGSKTVTASWTTSRLSRIITETFAFVNQTTPYDTVTTANGSGIAQALAAIASSAEKLVSDSLISSATGHVLTVGAGQTLTKEETSALAARVSTSTEPGAASVVMSWSTDISVDWAQIGFNLLPI